MNEFSEPFCGEDIPFKTYSRKLIPTLDFIHWKKTEYIGYYSVQLYKWRILSEIECWSSQEDVGGVVL